MNSTTKLLGALAAALTLAACSAESDAAGGTPVLSTTAPSASSPAAVESPAAESSSSTTGTPAPAGQTPVRFTVGDQSFDAVLNGTQVSQDLLETLPQTLPWFRNGGIEYITELDAPLTETGPFYTDVQPGDLVYDNPLPGRRRP